MKILGLDMATKTGWAVIENGVYCESGVQDFTKRRGEDNGIMFLRFRKWLYDLIRAMEIDLISYERAHYRGGAATEVCVGLQTRAQELASEAEIPCNPVATTTLKKQAVGYGKASKEQMIEAAAPIIGRGPKDDNEADAVLLAHIASMELETGKENDGSRGLSDTDTDRTSKRNGSRGKRRRSRRIQSK